MAGTFDGTTVRLFVDGAEVGTGTPAAVGIDYSSTSSLDLLLGQYGGPCSTTHAYAGMLDEPRIWNRALGSDEIAASAAMGAGPADRLAMDDAAADPIVYTSRFTAGKNLVISTESGSGARTIKNVTIADPIPYGWLVTCGRLLFDPVPLRPLERRPHGLAEPGPGAPLPEPRDRAPAGLAHRRR